MNPYQEIHLENVGNKKKLKLNTNKIIGAAVKKNFTAFQEMHH